MVFGTDSRISRRGYLHLASIYGKGHDATQTVVHGGWLNRNVDVVLEWPPKVRVRRRTIFASSASMG